MVRVSIKHAGKVYEGLELDPSQPGAAFKQTVYEKTGVPVDRMKVMIKGGMLKDDTDWSKVGPKEGQVFMVVGAAGELPKPPPKATVFLEDMDDRELASALNVPVGLTNLGNTCYMNATVQALRSIPELQTALTTYEARPAASNAANSSLTNALGSLYQEMSKTSDAFPPLMFLQILRQVNPQFAERGRSGGGFAQQDADECWSQILTSLASAQLGGSEVGGKWTDRYMGGEMETTMTCDEAPEEEPTTTKEKIMKLQCNISGSTNYMHTGIMDSLDQKITKNSPSLGREAVYTLHSRIARLPSNLTVQMVRFYWRADIGKKAKIMRKVKFPFEFDVLSEGMVTDELKKKLAPVNGRLKEIERERMERKKVRRRTKALKVDKEGDVEMGEASASASTSTPVPAVEEPKALTLGDLPDEKVQRAKEAEELHALVHPDLKGDIGSNFTGVYELCAIVTHKGASADGGHYIAWVRKDELEGQNADNLDSLKDLWYKFDDDKVSVTTQEKISALDGGGEDSTAYILLYRSKRLD